MLEGGSSHTVSAIQLIVCHVSTRAWGRVYDSKISVGYHTEKLCVNIRARTSCKIWKKWSRLWEGCELWLRLFELLGSAEKDKPHSSDPRSCEVSFLRAQGRQIVVIVLCAVLVILLAHWWKIPERSSVLVKDCHRGFCGFLSVPRANYLF